MVQQKNADTKERLAYKKALESDGRLKIPSRTWQAFLSNKGARDDSPQGKTRAVLELLYELQQGKVRFSRKTYEKWIGVAEELGLWKLRYALEDATFKTFDRENFELFESVVEKKIFMEQHLVLAIRDILENALCKAGIEKYSIQNRRKNIYGVFRKVTLKDININEVFDIHGFRVLVSSVDDCYRTLDVLHRLWPPLPERYKDYIKQPKENGYRSLHTVLSCLEKKPIEFQVRTREMDIIAASGPANHAAYKKVQSTSSKRA